MSVHWGGRGPGHYSRLTTATSGGGGSEFAITTPVLGDAAEPNIAGDWRPVYEIDFVNAYPTGGGIGDTLQCRYGDSQAAAEAVVTPDEAIVSESWWIDGEEPFPDLGDYGATLSPVADLVYQVRVKRGSDYSDWSNFKTLSIVDGVMTAPGWTDLTNQTASTRVWSSGVTVAGMASGAYARLLGTGPLKVGSTVYEAGDEVQVQNGATLYAGVDTSGTGGATVNNVVTNRGAALETFSATTAGAAAEATHRSTQIRDYGYGSTPGTAWDSFAIADGDKVVLHVHANENVGTITAISANSGAITFTQVGSPVSDGNDRVSLWYADTSGATAIAIAFTAGSSVKGIGFTAFSVTGAASGAPAASAKSYAYAGGDDAHDIDGGLAAATDGVLLLTACTPNSGVGDFVWTGATEAAEVDTTPAAMSSAIQTTAAAVSIAGPNVGGLGYTPLGRIASQWDAA